MYRVMIFNLGISWKCRRSGGFRKIRRYPVDPVLGGSRRLFCCDGERSKSLFLAWIEPQSSSLYA